MIAHDDVEPQSSNFETSQWITLPSPQIKSPVGESNQKGVLLYLQKDLSEIRHKINLAQTKEHVFGESSLHRQQLDIGLCGGELVSQRLHPWGAPLKPKIMLETKESIGNRSFF